MKLPCSAKYHRNHSPLITSVAFITMLTTSSKNIFVNVFLMTTGLKAFIKPLTESISWMFIAGLWVVWVVCVWFVNGLGSFWVVWIVCRWLGWFVGGSSFTVNVIFHILQGQPFDFKSLTSSQS